MPAKAMKVVSFSGIDGAGKSTQINALQRHLHELGLRSTVYTFWDNVAAFSRFRELISHRVFKGDMGVGSPEKPIQRRDKNVTSWHVAVGRLVLYLFDAISLRLTYAKISRSDTDVVIFDRYLYDELANLPLNRRGMRFYVRMLLKFVPRPDAAFLLDGDPEAAWIRKPEYPVEFLRQNREAYLQLSRLVGGMIVLPPLSPVETTAKMLESFSPNGACDCDNVRQIKPLDLLVPQQPEILV